MNTAVAVREDVTEAKILEYLDSSGITGDLLPKERKMFLHIAREFGLNPFKREIHISAFGKGEYRKCSIITGYEVYIKRAERTGKLDGWNARIEGAGADMRAVVEIHRKDQSHPFIHEAYYSECVQYNRDGKPNAVWAKQPKFMTKKVAIGQAFRLCFSDELGGMPYEEAELPQPTHDAADGERAEAAEFATVEEDSKKPEGGDARRELESLTGDIARILKEESADALPFFTPDELTANRELVRLNRANRDVKAMRDLHILLLKELAKRKTEYKPVPHGEEEFEDDIPDGMYGANEQAIF